MGEGPEARRAHRSSGRLPPRGQRPGPAPWTSTDHPGPATATLDQLTGGMQQNPAGSPQANQGLTVLQEGGGRGGAGVGRALTRASVFCASPAHTRPMNCPLARPPLPDRPHTYLVATDPAAGLPRTLTLFAVVAAAEESHPGVCCGVRSMQGAELEGHGLAPFCALDHSIGNQYIKPAWHWPPRPSCSGWARGTQWPRGLGRCMRPGACWTSPSASAAPASTACAPQRPRPGTPTWAPCARSSRCARSHRQPCRPAPHATSHHATPLRQSCLGHAQDYARRNNARQAERLHEAYLAQGGEPKCAGRLGRAAHPA